MSFGERLQQLRREHGMTQETFAEELKVSRQAVSKWESCRGYPEIEKILYICSRYGTTLDALFADELPPREAAKAEPQIAPALKRPTLKQSLENFFSNLSPLNKLVGGGLLAALVLLLLLFTHPLKGGSDYMMTIIWTAAVILFGVVEAATAGLVSIWFVCGALAALLAAFLNASIGVQVAVFLLISAAALAATRPLVRRFAPRSAAVATNLDQVLGARGRVTEEIRNAESVGAVYVGGKTWTARSADDSNIPAGTPILVERIEGVKLFVKKISENAEVVK